MLLCGDAMMRQLNHDFRGKDAPTNVLSFPSDVSGYLGDIAISLDTIAREASEHGKSVEAHLAHMLVHGLLHLLGYDHETQQEAERMESLEISILCGLGIDNPYVPM